MRGAALGPELHGVGQALDHRHRAQVYRAQVVGVCGVRCTHDRAAAHARGQIHADRGSARTCAGVVDHRPIACLQQVDAGRHVAHSDVAGGSDRDVVAVLVRGQAHVGEFHASLASHREAAIGHVDGIEHEISVALADRHTASMRGLQCQALQLGVERHGATGTHVQLIGLERVGQQYRGGHRLPGVGHIARRVGQERRRLDDLPSRTQHDVAAVVRLQRVHRQRASAHRQRGEDDIVAVAAAQRAHERSAERSCGGHGDRAVVGLRVLQQQAAQVGQLHIACSRGTERGLAGHGVQLNAGLRQDPDLSRRENATRQRCACGARSGRRFHLLDSAKSCRQVDALVRRLRSEGGARHADVTAQVARGQHDVAGGGQHTRLGVGRDGPVLADAVTGLHLQLICSDEAAQIDVAAGPGIDVQAAPGCEGGIQLGDAAPRQVKPCLQVDLAELARGLQDGGVVQRHAVARHQIDVGRAQPGGDLLPVPHLTLELQQSASVDGHGLGRGHAAAQAHVAAGVDRDRRAGDGLAVELAILTRCRILGGDHRAQAGLLLNHRHLRPDRDVLLRHHLHILDHRLVNRAELEDVLVLRGELVAQLDARVVDVMPVGLPVVAVVLVGLGDRGVQCLAALDFDVEVVATVVGLSVDPVVLGTADPVELGPHRVPGIAVEVLLPPPVSIAIVTAGCHEQAVALPIALIDLGAASIDLHQVTVGARLVVDAAPFTDLALVVVLAPLAAVVVVDPHSDHGGPGAPVLVAEGVGFERAGACAVLAQRLRVEGQ